jgi:hypothetical protein
MNSIKLGVPAISKHISNILEEGELLRSSTIFKMETVQKETYKLTSTHSQISYLHTKVKQLSIPCYYSHKYNTKWSLRIGTRNTNIIFVTETGDKSQPLKLEVMELKQAGKVDHGYLRRNYKVTKTIIGNVKLLMPAIIEWTKTTTFDGIISSAYLRSLLTSTGLSVAKFGELTKINPTIINQWIHQKKLKIPNKYHEQVKMVYNTFVEDIKATVEMVKDNEIVHVAVTDGYTQAVAFRAFEQRPDNIVIDWKRGK